MEESSDKQEEHTEDCTLESKTEEGNEPPLDNSVDHSERSGKEEEPVEHLEKRRTLSLNQDEHLSPSKTKVKRKLRSTRRKLNAMIHNSSLHFSDTDSEGELTTINYQGRSLNCTVEDQQRPTISVTLDNADGKEEQEEQGNYLSADGKEESRRNSFVDNLTDVDEIYPSDPESEQKESQNVLKVPESPCQGETDFEDVEDEEEINSPIYLKPRSDIFCEYSGETITTKEGDGPFSVEVRNKMYKEDISRSESCCAMPDIVVLSNTDEEDMEVSDDEDVQEACCSQKELFEDLEALAGSQVFMKNINKMDTLLYVKDTSDDVISDCHTDIEDVDPNE